MIFVTLIFLGRSCYKLLSTLYSPITYTTNQGEFNKSASNEMIYTYNSQSDKGFFASLDFELKDGKVEWEIVNPADVTVYKGYVIFEQGKVYRELTDFSYILSGRYSYSTDKEEVKLETDSNGKVINIPVFNYLQFDKESISGEYRLIIKPYNAEGSFKMEWSNKLARK